MGGGGSEMVLSRVAGVTKQQLPTNPCICEERPSDLLEGSSQSPALAPHRCYSPPWQLLLQQQCQN